MLTKNDHAGLESYFSNVFFSLEVFFLIVCLYSHIIRGLYFSLLHFRLLLHPNPGSQRPTLDFSIDLLKKDLLVLSDS